MTPKMKMNEDQEMVTNAKQPGKEVRREVDWFMTFFFTSIHLLTIHALHGLFTAKAFFATVLLQSILGLLTGHAMSAGPHRLWAHRAYKARTPLRILLALLHTVTFGGSVFWWVRTHRAHHKFTDTDADPHNSKNGFLYSHMLWLLLKKHADLAAKEKTINVEDLKQDWVVMFQRKYFYPLATTFSIILPTWIPWYFWGEAPLLAFTASLARITIVLHFIFCVNSVAHMYGTRPYNRKSSARESLLVAFISAGEGWHNYHHTFPWDYQNAEFGDHSYNLPTKFINLCAKLGLAYDLKVPSEELVRKHLARAQNTKGLDKVEIWGWGDTDMDEKEKAMALTVN